MQAAIADLRLTYCANIDILLPMVANPTSLEFAAFATHQLPVMAALANKLFSIGILIYLVPRYRKAPSNSRKS